MDKMVEKKRGRLTLVATPIGNLGDVSARQTEVLQQADLVAAEDTRHSGLLLAHLGVKKPMLSYYQHNEEKREGELLARLAEGQDIALVSDAGTPGICDPGSAILRAAVAEGFEVDAVPGPCAMIQALVLSGLSTERFAFEGFLPRGKAQGEFLQKLKLDERTLVFYEAPHRLRESLQVMLAVFGPQRRMAVCRELTKKFQEVQRGTVGELAELWREREPRGEFVLVVAGAEPAEVQGEADMEQVKAHLRRLLDGGMKHKAAARELAAVYNLPVSEVYALGVALKDE
ncbi:MAG: 16S rRNA (cytidine(1402)-2'-O)-methyltransferase [Firmicutes bacterium]|nr:16S rRNA (cytidine(1402)-2'-O)-methyltransferase [Bacillota bacterium]